MKLHLVENAYEAQLIRLIEQDHQRLRRIRVIETGILAKGDSETEAFLAHAKELQILTVIEQRINRGMQSNLKQLRELQAERKAEEAQALHEAQREQAERLVQFAAGQVSPEASVETRAMSPQPSAPERKGPLSGFVFSNAKTNSYTPGTSRNPAPLPMRHLGIAS